MSRFHLTATTRLILESGIFLSLLSFSAWLAVNAYKTEANASEITALKVEHQILARELVDTQKAIIKDVTEIKTKLGIQGEYKDAKGL